MARYQKKSGEIVSQLIAQLAATPEGFATAQAGALSSNAYAVAQKLLALGELMEVRVNKNFVRYFLDAKMASAFRQAYADPNRTDLSPAERAACPPALPGSTPKNATTARAVSIKAAVVVYPPNYKHSYHPMPAPRNQVVSHSFIHGGMGAMRA